MLSENWSSMQSHDFLMLLLALLPGLLTAEVVRILTTPIERKLLDRAVQALLYTFVTHCAWAGASGLISLMFSFQVTGVWQLLGLGASSIVLALAITWIINSDRLHVLLRRIGVSKAGSRPSVWYGAFYQYTEFIVVHLRDGRRLFGWPKEFPESAEDGHLLLTDMEWLDGENGSYAAKRTRILLDVKDIAFVEFVPEDNSQENGNARELPQRRSNERDVVTQRVVAARSPDR